MADCDPKAGASARLVSDCNWSEPARFRSSEVGPRGPVCGRLELIRKGQPHCPKADVESTRIERYALGG